MKKLVFILIGLLIGSTLVFGASDTEKTIDHRNANIVYLGSNVDNSGHAVVTENDIDNMVETADVPALVSTAAQGWVVASAADQSCVTTCGIATPLIAMEATSGLFVATNSATADSCICDGAIA